MPEATLGWAGVGCTGANSGAKRKSFPSWNDIEEREGAGLRGPIEPVVIFSSQKNVRLEGIEPSSNSAF
ncbi:MAG TPA: hypothetical protein DEO44_02100 [Verrucomicrobia subdivision 6 bacterium]|jgi:hypothetical protein|nr:hypothetical protein [Verrucomicrobia subdivision 6 bacterium]